MARFLKKSNALFQHIPRTGGTWIEQAIDLLEIDHLKWVDRQVGNIPNKHALLGHYVRRERRKVDFSFTFVRHPISYYEAIWLWLKGLPPHKVNYLLETWSWHPKVEPACAFSQSDSFTGFCRRMLEDSPCWVTRLFEWYCGPEGGEIVNWIGRTETLQSDFQQVMRLLGYENKLQQVDLNSLGKVNSHRCKQRPVWDLGLKNELERLEKRVIRRFYGSQNMSRRVYRPSHVFSN